MSSSTTFEILEIFALQGRDLPNKDYFKKQDPFLQYEIGSQFKRTKVDQKGGRNPQWNQKLRFERIKAPVKGKMKVKCYDDEVLGKPNFIGECDIDLGEIYEVGDLDDWFTLYDKGEKAGQIYLELSFYASDGITTRRKILDDERRKLGKDVKGSKSGSGDSLLGQIENLKLSEAQGISNEAAPKPAPIVQPSNSQPPTNKPTAPIEESKIQNPQVATSTIPPQPTTAQSEYASIPTYNQAPTNSVNPTSSNQYHSTNNTTYPPAVSATNTFTPTPAAASISNDTSRITPNPVEPIVNETKAPAEPILQNVSNVSASNISTNAISHTNQLSNTNTQYNSPQTPPNAQINLPTSLPPQASNNPGAAPVSTSDPTINSSIPNNPNPPNSTTHSTQPENHYLPSNNINTESTIAQPTSTANIGSKPSAYADNTVSESPGPQFSNQKPFTYDNSQPSSAIQAQGQPNPIITNPNTQTHSNATSHNSNTPLSGQNYQEPVSNNLSQPPNQITSSQPAQAAPNHSNYPGTTQTQSGHQVHSTHSIQPPLNQTSPVSQPQEYSNQSHSNAYPPSNTSQPPFSPSHQHPQQSYPTHSNQNTYLPHNAQQAYPPATNYYNPPSHHAPAPYPPPIQPQSPTGYQAYPPNHNSTHAPYPQNPHEMSSKPLFPSAADHLNNQSYPPSQFSPYHGGHGSYPPPPNTGSPSVNSSYTPYPPDTYSNYNSNSYHSPQFPTFPSADTSSFNSNYTSTPPPLPNRPHNPDNRTDDTPPPLPYRASMSFPSPDSNHH